MADDDGIDHILENSQRVLRLNDQYENHPSYEEFIKECSVMFVYGAYVLEEEALYECMEIHTKNIRFSPEHQDH